jgi:autotransporter-associated beta strand protein
MATGIISDFFMPVTNTGQYVSSFSANFTLLINYINRTTEPMADGFSVNFGKFNNTTSAYGGETGMHSPGDGKTGDVLTLGFYTYSGGDPRIELRYNGNTIATNAQDPFWNNQNPPPGTAFLPVNFSWDANGVDVSYNGSSIFSNVSVAGFSPGIDNSFAMAARTGAAYENLFVDNIAINTTVAPFVWSAGSGNWTTGGNWTIGTAPTTNNNWIVMAGAGGNANNNAVTAMEGLVFASGASGSYVLSGNAFTIGTDGIVNNSTSTQTVASNLTLGAAQTFRAANGALSFNGTINAGSNALTVNGSNAVTINGAISGAGASLVKTGSGNLTLGGANTYAGGTTVSGGRLIGTTSSLQGGIVNNAAVEFSQSTSGTYLGSISGSGSLTKSGAGALTLSGNSSYSGATTVSAGELVVDGSLASTTTVQNGATLSGSGSVGGLIINSGATVNPGNSPGTLSVNGNAVWNSGGNYDWESLATNINPNVQTGAGTNWDYMDISGTLTLGGLSIGNEFNLNLTSLLNASTAGQIPGWDPAVGSTWLIASAAGGIFMDATLVGTNQNYSSLFNINTAGWSGSLPSSGFQVITLGSTTDLYLQAVASAAVPEPGQVAASILLLVGIGGYVWMKRRKTTKAAVAAV